jgi:cysteinyl-tRNA synthetase
MDDDFNTPEAVAVLFDLATETNRSNDAASAGLLRELGGILGLLQREPDQFLQAGMGDSGLEPTQIEEMIAARTAAKQAKNYAEADHIRKELARHGVLLEDSAQSTTWRRE